MAESPEADVRPGSRHAAQFALRRGRRMRQVEDCVSTDQDDPGAWKKLP